jgi:glycosyltransferase involved in cell wall biosynthesis
MAMDKRMAALTIIIPTYNSAEYINQTLKCLNRQTSDDFKVVLIDDHSTDETLDLIKKFAWKKNISVIDKPKRITKGAAASLNYLFPRIDTPYLALIDSDCYLKANWVEKVLEKLPCHKLVGAPILAVKDKGLIAYLIGLEIESRYKKIKSKNLKHLSTCNLAGESKIFKKLKLNEHLEYAYDHQLSFILRSKGFQFYLTKETSCEHGNAKNLVGFFEQQFKIAKYHTRLAKKMPKEAMEGDEISPNYLILQPIAVFGILSSAFFSYQLALLFLGFLLFLNNYYLTYLLKKKLALYLLPATWLIILKNFAWLIGAVSGAVRGGK